MMALWITDVGAREKAAARVRANYQAGHGVMSRRIFCPCSPRADVWSRNGQRPRRLAFVSPGEPRVGFKRRKRQIPMTRMGMQPHRRSYRHERLRGGMGLLRDHDRPGASALAI